MAEDQRRAIGAISGLFQAVNWLERRLAAAVSVLTRVERGVYVCNGQA